MKSSPAIDAFRAKGAAFLFLILLLGGCASSGSGGGASGDRFGATIDKTRGGAQVLEVEEGSIAARAGIQEGDAITAVGGQAVFDHIGLQNLTRSATGQVKVQLIRGGRLGQVIEVTADFGGAAPGTTQPPPASAPPPPPNESEALARMIEEQNVALERQREQQAQEREERKRREVIERAAATRLPEGVKDISAAAADGNVGRFGGIFSVFMGEAEGGGFLLGIDSVEAPLQQKGRIVHLPESLYRRLERDGIMGELIRDMPAVVVRLVPPTGRATQPGVTDLEVLR